MNGDRIEMSQRERDRLKVLSVVVDGKRTQVEAARLLCLSVRQVRRIQRRLEDQGDAGIVHRLRGRTSNAQKCPQVRRQVLRIYAKDYPDFGPTLAAEKLTERGLPIAPETLRGWLIAAKFWKPRRRRHKHRRRRARRECFGELVQAKGRVERFNGTAQDRLVKELRLAGATTMAEANEVLEKKFLLWFHRRCTVKPGSPNKAHRPLHPSMKLAAILSIQQTRTVANDYTIQLDNTVYQLLPPARPGLRRGRVIVEKRADGSLRIRFKGRYLQYEVVGPAKPSGALPPNPRGLSLGRTPAEGEEGCAVAATQPSAAGSTTGRSGCAPAEPCPPGGGKQSAKNKPYVPAPDHPWRKGLRRRKKKRKNRTVLLGPNTGHF